MTSPTTYEEALEVLHALTAKYCSEPFFKKAEVVLSDGFHGVDVRVDGELWRKNRPLVQARINRVPVCHIMEG